MSDRFRSTSDSRPKAKHVAFAVGGVLAGVLAVGIAANKRKEKKVAGRGAVEAIDSNERHIDDIKTYTPSISRPVYGDASSTSFERAEPSARPEPYAQTARQQGTVTSPASPHRDTSNNEQGTKTSQRTEWRGLDPNEDCGYSGTTHLSYTENGVPQVRTRLRYGDIPPADRSEAQENAYRHDAAGDIEDRKEALRNLDGYKWWEEF